MSKRYAALLSPLRIGNTVLKNRTVFPNASPHFLQGPEDFPAEGYLGFYSALARNGAAIVTLAEWDHPHPRKGKGADFGHMQYFDTENAAVENYICQLADEIHFFGSKLILSTDLKFPQGFSQHGGFLHIPGGGEGIKVDPLPAERMGEVIDEFVARVKHYRDLGYDGVTMRVDSILIPHENERTDAYGGSVENRTRLVLDAYREIKRVLGPSFITEVQCHGEQPMGYTGENPIGYTIEDTIEFARLAEGVVDIIQLREKDMCISHPTGYTFQKGEHPCIGYSVALKEAGCRILTEPIGGFQDPEEINAYIASGKCDLIGMARAFFSNPHYGELLEAGRGEDITPCLWCNKCHGTILTTDQPDPWLSVCSVNPHFGIEHKEHRLLTRPGAPKKVAVIGGGPVGMRAAIMAAERGHQVTLFEKTDYLGGQLRHAESFSFKWPLRDFKNWEVRQLDKLGVEIRMNTAPAPEALRAEGFDTVIAATGSKANLPGSIEGLRDESGTPVARTCHDIFGKEAELGHHVIICGASETGIETAMYLAQNGHEVTLLTRQREIGHDCSKLHYITMAWVKPNNDGSGRGHMAPAWEKYEDVLHGITEVTTKSVCGSTVTYVDREGVEHTITGDDVIICGGTSAQVDEAMRYADAADQFLMVGDCNGTRNLQRGMRDALAKTNMI
ncbi:MAG: FAD-dependent oxidoreductase [Oscillospiraceae bacterium]|nr:FAD-dependent oxidoreductase [Oscillospiraceae bacterium]